MIQEDFSNMTDGAVPWFYTGWRCLYCGDIVDPLILRHRSRGRRAAEPPEQSLPRVRRWAVRVAMAHGDNSRR